MCREGERVDGKYCVCSVSPNLTGEEKKRISEHLKIFFDSATSSTSGTSHELLEEDNIFLSRKNFFILLDFFAKNGNSLIPYSERRRHGCITPNECVVNYCRMFFSDSKDSMDVNLAYLKSLKNWYLTEFFNGKLIDKIEKSTASQQKLSYSQIKIVINFFAQHGPCMLQNIW